MRTSTGIQAMYLLDGYRPSRGLTGWYRELTVREAKRCQGTLYVVDGAGSVRECRTNGAPKVWKTRPGCVLSLKYGLKQCFQAGYDYLKDDKPLSGPLQPTIVVPVKAKFAPDTPAGIVADWCIEHEIGG